MLNYMAADLSRIFKRIPRLVLMLISFGVFCAAIAIYVSVLDLFSDPAFQEIGIALVKTSDSIANAIRQVAGYATGIFGLFELIFVFSDDIKAKTTQIAIGVGASRGKVVLSKFFELLIVLMVDMAVMIALSMMMSGVMGGMLNGAQLLQLTKELSVSMLLYNISYASLVFMLLFTTQSMSQSIICFLALNFRVISSAVGFTNNIKALANLNLSNYTLTTMLDKISNMAKGSAFDIMPFLACLAYVVVALAISILLFKKKELEF